MDLDLVLGSSGATLSGILPRLYQDRQRIAMPGGAALSPVPGSTVAYTLSGLPDAGDLALAYEFPAGVFSARWWGGPAVPTWRIAPYRIAGLSAGDIGATVLLNGSPIAPPSVVELGSGGEPGDYLLSGWPAADFGDRFALYYSMGGIFSGDSWRRGPAPDSTLSPETVVRRVLGTYWLTQWLGPDLNERRFCPARVLGFAGSEVSFDAGSADDVRPWTPSEVKAEAGYALMRLREMDRFDTMVTAGSVVVAGETRIASEEYRLYWLDFELVAPSKLKTADPVELLERRAARIEQLFYRLPAMPVGDTPVLDIRNLARYPSRRRPGTDDGDWRRAFLSVQVVARVRTTHVDPQEVSIQ